MVRRKTTRSFILSSHLYTVRLTHWSVIRTYRSTDNKPSVHGGIFDRSFQRRAPDMINVNVDRSCFLQLGRHVVGVAIDNVNGSHLSQYASLFVTAARGDYSKPDITRKLDQHPVSHGEKDIKRCARG